MAEHYVYSNQKHEWTFVLFLLSFGHRGYIYALFCKLGGVLNFWLLVLHLVVSMTSVWRQRNSGQPTKSCCKCILLSCPSVACIYFLYINCTYSCKYSSCLFIHVTQRRRDLIFFSSKDNCKIIIIIILKGAEQFLNACVSCALVFSVHCLALHELRRLVNLPSCLPAGREQGWSLS